MTPIVEAQGLTLIRDGQPTLEDVTLRVKPGVFLGIIGPNGGGKSTLLQVFAGLLQPDSGSVRVLGLPPGEAGAQVGYVPQETGFNLAFPIDTLAVVTMGLLGQKLTASQQKERAMQALRRVGIAHLAARRIGHLSGGERQRAFIARALCGNPKLLLLDEPTANLDPKAQGDIYTLLKSLQPEITVVLISHDISHLIGFADEVAALNRRLLHHEKLPADQISRAHDGHICEVELLGALLKKAQCD